VVGADLGLPGENSLKSFFAQAPSFPSPKQSVNLTKGGSVVKPEPRLS
jgi:hypothetical protein